MFYKHKTQSLAYYKNILIEYIPELSTATFRKLHGYDSVVLLANNERVFKFPQRVEVVEHYELKKKILPVLQKKTAQELPLVKHFFGTKKQWQTLMVETTKVSGNHLSTVMFSKRIDERMLIHFGEQIGTFLTTLHASDADWAIQKGVPAFDANRWDKEYNWVREHCYPLWNTKQKRWVDNLYTSFLQIWHKKSFTPVLIHGDFGSWHIYANQKTITGFIDWGGMRIDDPIHDIKWQARSSKLDHYIGKGVLKTYTFPLDPFVNKRAEFYKNRSPVSKYSKGIERNDPQRIKDGLMLFEQYMN